MMLDRPQVVHVVWSDALSARSMYSVVVIPWARAAASTAAFSSVSTRTVIVVESAMSLHTANVHLAQRNLKTSYCKRKSPETQKKTQDLRAGRSKATLIITMSYSSVLVPETRLRLGADFVLINPLLDNAYLHRHEHQAAYVDRDRRVRVSSFAILARPRAAYAELLRLGNGRWTETEVAEAISGANLYLRRALS
jgi:hypothetical protein